MEANNTFQTLQRTGVSLPKLITLRQAEGEQRDGAALPRQQLVIKRVKNPEPLRVIYDADGWQQCEAKLDSWNDLAMLWHDETLSTMREWAEPALLHWAEQTLHVSKVAGTLLMSFLPRGKWLFHGPGAAHVPVKYVSANSTMELHYSDMQPIIHAFAGNRFIHLLGQHLDYPSDTGKRRHSTSRLFDLCFAIEKIMGEEKLAAQIDRYLSDVWGVAPRDQNKEYAQAQALLGGAIASVNSSPDRVRQRARFAALVEYMFSKKSINAAPILQHYMKLVRLDTQWIIGQDQSYPFKERDSMADAMHASLATILEATHARGIGKFTQRFA